MKRRKLTLGNRYFSTWARVAWVVGWAMAMPAPAQAEELFNGKDLTGWVGFFQEKEGQPVPGTAETWQVVDGVLECTGKPIGLLRTTQPYENYVLSLDWRWAPDTKGGNSGVLLHAQAPADKVWPPSIEAQLKKGTAGEMFTNDVTMTVPKPEGRVDGRRHKRYGDNYEKPIGEWNHYEITCKGNTIAIKVNGTLVNEAENVSVRKGFICLQSEGSPLHFRNIELMPLP